MSAHPPFRTASLVAVRLVSGSLAAPPGANMRRSATITRAGVIGFVYFLFPTENYRDRVSFDPSLIHSYFPLYNLFGHSQPVFVMALLEVNHRR